jgi:hypothetical protein
MNNLKIETFAPQRCKSNASSPMIPPLPQVQVQNLQPGNAYLIQEKRPEHQHIKFKGTFIKTEHAATPGYATMTHFNNVIGPKNCTRCDLRLVDAYWNYYEADAQIRAWTNHALREITGDPSFKVASTTQTNPGLELNLTVQKRWLVRGS